MHLESTFRRQKLDQNCLNDIMVSFGDTSLGETYNCHLTFEESYPFEKITNMVHSFFMFSNILLPSASPNNLKEISLHKHLLDRGTLKV